jgi:hypothetical protein
MLLGKSYGYGEGFVFGLPRPELALSFFFWLVSPCLQISRGTWPILFCALAWAGAMFLDFQLTMAAWEEFDISALKSAGRALKNNIAVCLPEMFYSRRLAFIAFLNLHGTPPALEKP